jgi:hypothetical protein
MAPTTTPVVGGHCRTLPHGHRRPSGPLTVDPTAYLVLAALRRAGTVGWCPSTKDRKRRKEGCRAIPSASLRELLAEKMSNGQRPIVTSPKWSIPGIHCHPRPSCHHSRKTIKDSGTTKRYPGPKTHQGWMQVWAAQPRGSADGTGRQTPGDRVFVSRSQGYGDRYGNPDQGLTAKEQLGTSGSGVRG